MTNIGILLLCLVLVILPNTMGKTYNSKRTAQRKNAKRQNKTKTSDLQNLRRQAEINEKARKRKAIERINTARKLAKQT